MNDLGVDIDPRALPPGPPLPALAQTLLWATAPGPLMRFCQQRYGDPFTIHITGFGPFVFFSAPDDVKRVFTGDPALLHAGEGNSVLKPVVGSHSVLLLDRDPHMRQRRLLLPPFHGERMHAYGEVIRAAALRSLDSWPVGRPFRLHDQTQAMTMDVILRAVFGLEDGTGMRELTRRLVELVEMAASPLSLLTPLQKDLGRFSPWGRFLARREAADRALYAVIDERRRARDRAQRQDILSLLLSARDEQGQPLTDRELRDELVTLLIAGHETTATGLAWAFERVLAHPEVHARLRDEVDDACAGGEVEPEALAALPYLDAVIKETLRLRPVIPIVARRLKGTFPLAGYELPPGTMLAPCIYLTHRRPEIYPEPERFWPERFLGAKADPYGYYPFGGGIRRCIGMAFALYEMKILLATLLSRAQLELAPGYRARTARRSVTMAPSGGTPVIMRERRAPRVPVPRRERVAASA